ncbi:MAG: DUF5715 family protein [Candidatus Saccharimonadales bacterium]
MFAPIIKKLRTIQQNGLTTSVIQLGRKAPAAELERVQNAIRQELEWMSGFEPYNNNEDIDRAVADGELVPVTEDDNLRPVMRYRNPELIRDYPPYLRQKPYQLLQIIGQRWRDLMRERGLSEDIKLAVSMLTCTKEYQQKLIQGGKLAVDKGPHSCGFAFDIDGCGYYLGDTPINPRPDKQSAYTQAFASAGSRVVPFGSYEQYDRQVHLLLDQVLDSLASEGLIHFILEYPDSNNSSYHICTNPETP